MIGFNQRAHLERGDYGIVVIQFETLANRPPDSHFLALSPRRRAKWG